MGTSLDLLAELVTRNRVGQAPHTRRMIGNWHECLIAVGKDETAYIYLTNEALTFLMENDDEHC